MRAKNTAKAALAGALAAALAFTGIQPASADEATALVALEEAEYAIDSDGDGLPDDWETNGVVLLDGTKVPLQDWGADPHRPDIYLQLNWMADHNGKSFGPTAESLQEIVDLFDAHGIALHIDAGETYTNTPNYTEFNGGETLPYEQHYFGGELTGVKLLRNIDTYLGERSNVFRLGVIGDQIDRGNMSTGVSLIGDSAFFVANNAHMETEEQLRNTILHELGHTLGLRNNGSAAATRALPRYQAASPEYVSVMSYDHQFTHFNFSEEAYTVNSVNGPVEIPADWDALVLNTPRIAHDALALGASAVSHGAAVAKKAAGDAAAVDEVAEIAEIGEGDTAAAAEAEASEASDAADSADAADAADASSSADKPADEPNVAAIIGAIVAALALIGIAGGAFAALNGMLPF